MGGSGVRGGDVDSIVSYWTDDAVMFPPDLPAVMGRPALRERHQASLQIPGFSITWRSTEVALSSDRNLACMFGENAVTMDGPDGTPTTIRAGASPSGVENQTVNGAAQSTSGTWDQREGCTPLRRCPVRC